MSRARRLVRTLLISTVLLALVALTSQCSAEPLPRTVQPSSTTTPEQSSRPEDVEAAVVHRWGPVVAGDEFDYDGRPNPKKWIAYDSVGHDGKGLRKPTQIEVLTRLRLGPPRSVAELVG